MATKSMMEDFRMRLATAPKARQGRAAKPARLRGFPVARSGKSFPPHFPPPPGAFRDELRPSVAAPEPRLGPLGGKLGRPLDISQVAEMIGCSPWTVRQTLIPRGLPHFRFKASGRLTFYEGQVIRWIENQQQGGNTTK